MSIFVVSVLLLKVSNNIMNLNIFELHGSWTGVLVEANPTAFAALKFSGRNRADLVNAAPACNATSSVRIRNHKFTSAALTSENDPDIQHSSKVPCISLTSLLESLVPKSLSGNPQIDFFSLDVEGAEDLVLSTVDFDKLSLPLLLIESVNRQCPERKCPKRDAVRERMIMNGYMFDASVPSSDLFWKIELMRVRPHKHQSKSQLL